MVGLLQQVIEIAATPGQALPARAVAMARFSLVDWMACGIAGAGEPVAEKLRKLATEEGGKPAASVFGGGRFPARMAALANGAASHALDYDDTHFAHVGHLSVGVYPAALAAGEESGATAQQVLDAFLVGAEAAIRIGVVLGRAHYNLGFHQTATAGAFGATVAAGRLYGLDAQQMTAALGLCATRASGLKSQFGTMGKPYNAGVAAANGVECASLARLGMTSADDGLLGLQGFIPTHTPQAGDPAALPATDIFLFEDNKYKLHACCHGLHPMIEAMLGAPGLVGARLEDISAIALSTNPRWLKVCDIKAPRTGLEVKFSYNWLAGMTIRGDRTGDDRIYSDAMAADPQLQAFAPKMTVEGDDSLTDLEARGRIVLADGRSLDFYHDLDAPLTEDVLASKLRAKAEAMLGERGARIWDRLSDLSGASAADIGALIAQP